METYIQYDHNIKISSCKVVNSWKLGNIQHVQCKAIPSDILYQSKYQTGMSKYVQRMVLTRYA